jgi:hypothetical protein
MKKIFLLILVLAVPLFFFGNDIEIIQQYYQLLDQQKFKEAYQMSPQKVSYSKFLEWYGNAIRADVYNIIQNKKDSYTFQVFLVTDIGTEYEKDAYQVTMEIKNSHIINSTGKPLDSYIQKKLNYHGQNIILKNDVKKMYY